MKNARNRRSVFSVLATSRQRKQQPLIGSVVVNVMAKEQSPGQANYHAVAVLLYLCDISCKLQKIQPACTSGAIHVGRKRGVIWRGMFLMEKGICCTLTAANGEYHNKIGY